MATNDILTYWGSLIKVIDGDTADLEINLGFGIQITERLRFAGVDTPEINNTPASSTEHMRGQTEKIFVKSWFNDAPDPCLVEVLGKGYFGRWVAIIRPAPGEPSLNDALRGRGWGVETFTRSGRPFWNPVGKKIDIEYPKGKLSTLGPDSRAKNREV